ncbi:MAG: putative metal-binding motif-containing protein [Saprospiraceae bacterium]|nr:putative metal-binding motif-containing protein [Saprospiraceae bacterium]
MDAILVPNYWYLDFDGDGLEVTMDMYIMVMKEMVTQIMEMTVMMQTRRFIPVLPELCNGKDDNCDNVIDNVTDGYRFRWGWYH